MYFHVYSFKLQIHAHIYRSFIRHHKMLGVRIAKRTIEPQKPANHCGTKLCTRIFFVNTLQLVASGISLATSFFISLQSSSRAHSAAPRFQIEPAALGFDLVLGTNLEAATSILLRYSSSLQSSSCAHAVDRLR